MTTIGQCYYIHGKPIRLGVYVPCNQTAVDDGGHTSCCAPGDYCLDNGLCQSQLDAERKSNHFWRNGCTDSSWSAPECLRQCPNSGNLIFYCLKSQTWACNDNAENLEQAVNTTGCSVSDLVFQAPDPTIYETAALPDFVATATKTSTLLSATETTIKSTSTAPPGTSESGGSSSDKSDNLNSKIGIYVGVPLGIVMAIALAVIVWMLLRKRKNSRLSQDASENTGIQETHDTAGFRGGKKESSVYARQELPSYHEPLPEMPGSTA